MAVKNSALESRQSHCHFLNLLMEGTLNKIQVLSLTTCLLILFSIPAQSSEDSLGLELIQGAVLKGDLSPTTFSMGMQLTTGSDYLSEASTTDAIRVTGNIYPDPEVIGELADIFVVVASPAGLFMRDIDGSFISWNGKASDLVTAMENIPLTEMLSLELFSGNHSSAGLYRYFIAYMESGSTQLVYSTIAARFTVSNPPETLLWRVSNGVNEMIVGGTIHLLRQEDYPLHTAYSDAYNETDILVTEVAGEEFGEINSLAILFLNNEGTLLVNELSAGLYTRLRNYLQNAGENISNYEQIHPNWVAQTLVNLELDRLDFDSGVDGYFLELAAMDGKQNYGLESLASQILLVKNLDSSASAEEIISGALDDIESGVLATELAGDILAWVAADVAHFEASLAEIKEENPEDYDLVFTNRNESWIPDLESFLQTPEVEYVLVGAGHVIGDDSILVMLEARGYTVERYQPPFRSN